MSRKLIIIGAQGMLGQELGRVFSDWQPLLWDREKIDITDRGQVSARLEAERPELVLNAAAYNDVDGAEKSPAAAMAVNADGPKNVADACRVLGATMVHYSTDYVFKGDQPEGYREDDRPDPQSVYATSKFAGEQAVLAVGCNAYVIRLSRLFGKPAAGANAKRSFVDVMVSLAQKNNELRAVDEELSSPTYAPDLAQRTREIIEAKQPYGIYHVSNAGACTWYGLAREIFTITGQPITIEPVPASAFPRPASRPRYSILLNTKLPPLRPWQQALREYLQP